MPLEVGKPNKPSDFCPLEGRRLNCLLLMVTQRVFLSPTERHVHVVLSPTANDVTGSG